MAGKSLVFIRGCCLHEIMAANYPKIQLVEAKSAAAAMAMVAEGQVDAVATSFIAARYLISRKYRDRLRVSSTVGTEPAQISFGMTPGTPELYSILNKALLSISPEETDDLINRWRSDVVVDDSYWLRNRSAIIQGFAIAAVLLLVALGWIAYLRKLIRKRVQAEQALNDQLEFMQVLIDGTPHPIYVRDRQGRLLICNPSYLDVYGDNHGEMQGKTLIEGASGCSDELLDYHRDALDVMSQGLPRVQDRVLTLPDGRELAIYHWMLPYRASDGEVTGMIGGWIDISERQLLIEQLQEAKREADDANRAKTTFLATMSHEIRTPMNAVIGMLELAMKRADQGVMDRFAIEVASGAAQDLLDLIGDILDIARIESGRLSLTPGRANLRELVQSVVRILDGLARQKLLNLVLDLDANADRDVVIDPLRFKQILSNLVSNAIKFTGKGEVRVILRIQPAEEEQELKICLRIEDSGHGISTEDQQRLFSPFTQASNNTQSARTGSGLGLVISRTLCEMMGGQLHLSSVLGRGTQVEVKLVLPTLEPLSVVQSMEPEPSLEHALNILVIDDYSANRVLLSQQLSYLGHRVRDAEDGAQGLRDWQNGQFDVVITDCNMPVMNGYELTRAIREFEQSQGNKPCRILGFTANAQPEEKDRCRASGMDDCLFKPISLQDLKACLASVEPWQQLELDVPASTDDIDLANVRQLTQGDPAMIKRLLDDLAGCIQKDLDLLLKLFVRHDLSGLADLAHRVKGGARIIKAHGLIACCERLEFVCASAQETSLLTPAVDELQQAMERMVIMLDDYGIAEVL
jgi:two-component system sensor histidine kinase EvgS